MYSGDAPSYFAPGGYDQQHLQPSSTVSAPTNLQIQATGDVYRQPPSQGDMNHGQGKSLNQFQGATTYRGLGQPTVTDDNNINTKPPSFTELNQGQTNSYNQDLNIRSRFGGSYYGDSGSGQPPSAGAMAKVNVSQTSDGHVDYKDEKAPGQSDVDRRGSSETGTSSTIKLDVPDAQELVGISLVGKNFRKFYPNAYYREEDED